MKNFIFLVTIYLTFWGSHTQNLFAQNSFDTLWSTYVGAMAHDEFRGLATDSKNNIIIGGISESSQFPVTDNCYQHERAGYVDMVLLKFSPEGELIWSTYIGGSSRESIFEVLVNNKDEIIVCGETVSPNFKVSSDAYQKKYAGGSGDAVLMKFSPNGNLLYSTFFGGSSYDVFGDMCQDSDGNIWLTGRTNSGDFPVTKDAYHKFLRGVYDAFIVKFDKDFKLIYSSLFGGSESEFAEGIDCDKDGNIAISGYTSSVDLPLNGINYQNKFGGELLDGFVAKFDSKGNLKWSTYLGGSDIDYASQIACDNDDNFIIAGYTQSTDFPIFGNSFQSHNAGRVDDFVAKFDNDGNMIWCTYFGGDSNEGLQGKGINDQGGSIDFDSKNNIIFTGRATLSTDLPVSDPTFISEYQGSADAYVVIMDESGDLIWSSYIGGKGTDMSLNARFDNDDNIIVVGGTTSLDFPIFGNTFQKNKSESYDAFIIKLGTLISPCHETYFDFPSSHNSGYFGFAGVGRSILDSAEFFRLTPSKEYMRGAVWYDSQVPVDKGFITEFTFRFSDGYNGLFDDGSLPGADGIAFVIHNGAKNPIGDNGGGMGFQGIKNSLAIEIDTYYNELAKDNIFDKDGNHVAVFCNGTEKNTANHNSQALLGESTNIPIIKSDSTLYYVKIDYNVLPNTLRVYISETSNFTTPSLVLDNFKLDEKLQLDMGRDAYVGITSATGIAHEVHDILSWYFCPFPSQTQTSVEAIDNNNGIKISPNPVSDVLRIDFDNIERVEIDIVICDISGRNISQIYSGTSDRLSSMTIPVYYLNPGVYFLKIESANGVKSMKFIKR